jgi:hypothetical protein
MGNSFCLVPTYDEQTTADSTSFDIKFFGISLPRD